MAKLFELERDRHDNAVAARKVVDTAIAANRDLSPEEKADVEARQAKIADLSRKIELFKLADTFAPTEDRSAQRGGAGLGPELPDLENYSILRAVRQQIAVREGVYGARFDGLEAEVHQELAKTKPDGSEVRGFLVPWHLASHRRQFGHKVEQRADVTTSTAAGGIANILGTDLIQYLRNRMVMENMGARVITGLSGGSFSLPKQTGAETAYHVGEAAAPTASALALAQVTWTPRTLAALSRITRKTILQSSLDVEALVRQSIVLTLAVEFDRVGINGSGSGQVPLGIMQDPNVPIVAIGANGGAPTWAMILALESSVATANADFGRLGYLTSNKGRAQLKATPKIGSTFPIFMWENARDGGVGEVNGYSAMATTQVPSNLTKGSGTALTSLIFGNFESATYGLWSGVDILVDPYSESSKGNIILNAFQDYDFQMRWESAFSACSDMTTP